MSRSITNSEVSSSSPSFTIAVEPKQPIGFEDIFQTLSCSVRAMLFKNLRLNTLEELKLTVNDQFLSSLEAQRVISTISTDSDSLEDSNGLITICIEFNKRAIEYSVSIEYSTGFISHVHAIAQLRDINSLESLELSYLQNNYSHGAQLEDLNRLKWYHHDGDPLRPDSQQNSLEGDGFEQQRQAVSDIEEDLKKWLLDKIKHTAMPKEYFEAHGECLRDNILTLFCKQLYCTQPFNLLRDTYQKNDLEMHPYTFLDLTWCKNTKALMISYTVCSIFVSSENNPESIIYRKQDGSLAPGKRSDTTIKAFRKLSDLKKQSQESPFRPLGSATLTLALHPAPMPTGVEKIKKLTAQQLSEYRSVHRLSHQHAVYPSKLVSQMMQAEAEARVEVEADAKQENSKLPGLITRSLTLLLSNTSAKQTTQTVHAHMASSASMLTSSDEQQTQTMPELPSVSDNTAGAPGLGSPLLRSTASAPADLNSPSRATREASSEAPPHSKPKKAENSRWSIWSWLGTNSNSSTTRPKRSGSPQAIELMENPGTMQDKHSTTRFSQ